MNKAVVALMVAALTLGFTAMASADEVETVEDLSGGDVTGEDLEQDRETVNWAMIYGTVDETVSLTDDGEDVFSWDEAESAADGSAVLAAQDGVAVDSDSIESVDSADDLEGVPETGADSFENTFTEDDSSPEVLDDSTSAAVSESYSGDEDSNLFVYSEDADNDSPVWAGLVETGQMHEDGDEDAQDYEVLVGEDGTFEDSSYDLYVELEDQ